MIKKFSIILGAIFVVVGILGFIPNPIVGIKGLFNTNLAHDIVHILLGVVLLIGGMQSSGSASLTLKVVAGVYLLVAILGFILGPGLLLGFLEINTADNWLHLVLAVILVVVSMSGGDNGGSSAPTAQP